ncbi:MAG: glycosyltransferase [Bacilli bacterium]|nr:glycosyltransferase [Bacilli bacterium]
MKQIRILQYIGSLNIGGSQTMIMELYRNIDKKKIQFDFIIDKEEKYFQKEIESLGGKVYVLPNYNGKNHFLYTRAWDDFFENHKEYKIIHSHVRSTAAIVLKIAKKYGLITISHSHSTSNGKGISSVIKKIYQYKIRYIANYFIGCSKESCIWLFGKKVADSNKCFVLNNSINTEKFLYNSNIRNTIRKKYHLEDKFIIGTVGRFVESKNHKFILEIFNEIQKNNKEAFLLLIGDESSLKCEIQNKIKDLNLEDKVLILTNRSDVNEFLQVMDVFVMPSIYEGLPVTLIEAQAASLPIVMSDTITDEVIITNLITKLSLEDDIKIWVQNILKYKNFKRYNTKKEIQASGYDISKNVNWLTEFYMKLGDKNV